MKCCREVLWRSVVTECCGEVEVSKKCFEKSAAERCCGEVS